MPTPRFRAGRIVACPCFLNAIPRSAMIAAIVSHVTSEPSPLPFRTSHSHEGRAFYLETHKNHTVIRLEEL